MTLRILRQCRLHSGQRLQQFVDLPSDLFQPLLLPLIVGGVFSLMAHRVPIPLVFCTEHFHLLEQDAEFVRGLMHLCSATIELHVLGRKKRREHKFDWPAIRRKSTTVTESPKFGRVNGGRSKAQFYLSAPFGGRLRQTSYWGVAVSIKRGLLPAIIRCHGQNDSRNRSAVRADGRRGRAGHCSQRATAMR